MKTIVKGCRVWSNKSKRWLRVDVDVELDPVAIANAYAHAANKNKSGRSKQLGGLVVITRRSAMPDDEAQRDWEAQELGR